MIVQLRNHDTNLFAYIPTMRWCFALLGVVGAEMVMGFGNILASDVHAHDRLQACACVSGEKCPAKSYALHNLAYHAGFAAHHMNMHRLAVMVVLTAGIQRTVLLLKAVFSRSHYGSQPCLRSDQC